MWISCQELRRAGNLCFLTRVWEGTLGLVDYHCRAPFRPSVPWCFPVREVRLFKAICWLKDVANSCRSRSSAAATTKVAAEQLTAGAGQQEGHVEKLPRAGILWFLTRVSEGTLGLVDYHCRAPFRPSVPWCFPVWEVRLFKAIYCLKDVVNSCGLQRWQTGAKRCQELLRVGPCVL